MKTPLRLLAVSVLSLGLGLTVVPHASAKQLALATTYACDTALGGGPTSVGVIAQLPKTVGKNDRVRSDTANVALVLPAEIVDVLRDYDVRSIAGTISGATLSVGSTPVKTRGLKIAATAVPESGSMVLNGAGTRVGFSIAKTGTYAVTVPGSFAAALVGTTGDGTSAQLAASCALQSGSPAKLGTVKVTR